MNIDSDNDGGADIFWPGYVDAVTNLVLNLLFVVVIMTVAVFIFAMELGRRSKVPPSPTPQAEQQKPAETPQTPVTTPDAAKLQKQVDALLQQVADLKDKEHDAQRLQEELAALQQDTAPGKRGPHKVVKGSVRSDEPVSAIDKITGGLVVDFNDDAVTLSDEEGQKLRGPIASIVASGGAKLEVNVPPGFTEAKRLGYYRAMAVRNLLIEMKLPADRIEVSVKEGVATSDSSLVLVSPAGTP
ncbi:hypothetical protein [Methyloradius palustris]|uniref:Uncharacterized protein n=1 Tax=Methyloradius palustris TaxID=2778876 RepID=A0A8E4G0Q8_9PROT|nr:hypothetical protein [Methyloradius palustris]BCM26287.1 hypothetical protein ZMTM_25460 [Methyloradius palustris]